MKVSHRKAIAPGRRRILRAGLASGALFLPVPYAWVWAQSEGAMRLLRAPKLALVVGNSTYKNVPELKNPANDAKAIAGTLKGAGFEVTMKLDTTREEMLGAIRAYLHLIGQKKHIGLFYFAGHGVQLAWRNYLLPVDAVIRSIEDVAKQGIDIAQLMEGLTRAANPMNVIILDACRENPFGKDVRVEQKGLSQMDAPNSTLLAYATSPGNVASDGDGTNGLYTENLLREIQVPETKVEDVFKRVRLGVRRKSNGTQIPWESTSLEEDFWFLPPREIKAASDAEKERLFAEELALWEKIQSSTVPAALEDFLLRHPSGSFSELAQLQLDRVLAKQGEKRIAAASQAGNPYTQGTARANIGYKVGDSYTYRVLDLETKAQKHTNTSVVSEVRESSVVFSVESEAVRAGAPGRRRPGPFIVDLLGNTVELPDGRRYTPRQDQPLEYAIGRRWSTRFSATTAKGIRSDLEFNFRITRKERIEVPAGSFECFVIEGVALGVSDTGNNQETRATRWMAPDTVRRPIANEITRKVLVAHKEWHRRPIERVEQSERHELTSYKQS